MKDTLSRQIVTCRYRVSALPQLPDARGQFKLGPLAHPEPGTPLEICGDRYKEITVKLARRDILCFQARSHRTVLSQLFSESSCESITVDITAGHLYVGNKLGIGG
jgi:hypothetical protein